MLVKRLIFWAWDNSNLAHLLKQKMENNKSSSTEVDVVEEEDNDNKTTTFLNNEY